MKKRERAHKKIVKRERLGASAIERVGDRASESLCVCVWVSESVYERERGNERERKGERESKKR